MLLVLLETILKFQASVDPGLVILHKDIDKIRSNT